MCQARGFAQEQTTQLQCPQSVLAASGPGWQGRGSSGCVCGGSTICMEPRGSLALTASPSPRPCRLLGIPHCHFPVSHLQEAAVSAGPSPPHASVTPLQAQVASSVGQGPLSGQSCSLQSLGLGHGWRVTATLQEAQGWGAVCRVGWWEQETVSEGRPHAIFTQIPGKDTSLRGTK